eukprot:COSAG05_NODE_19444_length_292_cov_1.341969_1_plen_30_part_10
MQLSWPQGRGTGREMSCFREESDETRVQHG